MSGHELANTHNLFLGEEGESLDYGSSFLFLSSLSPFHVEAEWRVTRLQLFVLGLRSCAAALDSDLSRFITAMILVLAGSLVAGYLFFSHAVATRPTERIMMGIQLLSPSNRG